MLYEYGVSSIITTGCSVFGALATDQYLAVLFVPDTVISIIIPIIFELAGTIK